MRPFLLRIATWIILKFRARASAPVHPHSSNNPIPAHPLAALNMARHSSGSKGRGRSLPRPVNRKDGTMKRWNKPEDIPMDEEDQCTCCIAYFERRLGL